MTSLRAWCAGVVTALSVAAVSTACGDSGPSDGHALGDDVSGQSYAHGYTVGQRVIDASGGIANDSDKPLELISIQPIFAKGAEVVSVYRIAIMLPVKVYDGTVTGGNFLLWPPAFSYPKIKGCLHPKFVPVKGYVLEPHGGEQMALFLHMRKPGTWHINGERVTYQQAGRTYQEVVHVATSSRIRRGSPDKPHGDERQCHGRPLTEVPRAPLSETGTSTSSPS